MYPDDVNILCHLGDHNYNVTDEDRGVQRNKFEYQPKKQAK